MFGKCAIYLFSLTLDHSVSALVMHFCWQACGGKPACLTSSPHHISDNVDSVALAKIILTILIMCPQAFSFFLLVLPSVDSC